MNCYRYKNFINGDPILDWFNYKRLSGNLLYKKDDDYKTFDKQLLLETYTAEYKKKFCNLIKQKFRNDAIWIFGDTFIIKNTKIKKHFINYTETSEGCSLFTIEYSTLNVLKSGQVSSIHKWYNFKNWYYKEEYKNKYNIKNSYIIGRKYKGSIISNRFDNLAINTLDYSQILKSAEKHLENIKYNTYEPNFNNKSDFPWHHAKKLYKTINNKQEDQKFYINNTLNLKIPEMSPANIYIDYEMLTSVYDDFVDFPYSNEKVVVFNIGVYRDNMFNSFYATSLEQEYEMLRNFISYLNNIDEETITFYHWTGVEKRIFNEKLLQYPDLVLEKSIKWFDLHDYFVKSKVLIGGCDDKKLKNVCRVLYENGLIKTKWENGLIYDGLGSMTGYLKYLKTKETYILNNIIDYNMVDCKVLQEIHQLLLSLSRNST